LGKQNGSQILFIKMESSKNNNSNNGGDEQPQQQLGRSTRKRQLNQWANDGKAAEEHQIEQEEGGSSSKMNRSDGRNDQDLEVPRHQLGQIVPQVGDRHFAAIVQSFLHNYGRITLASISITDTGHPLIQPAVAIPENVKDFLNIYLRFAIHIFSLKNDYINIRISCLILVHKICP
jgi:hypothetical protein